MNRGAYTKMPDVEQHSAPIGGLFSYQMPVRWGDMDAMGHVNNTVYFRYFEEARVVLFERMGLTFGAERGWVLAHASCDFLRPLLYPAHIVVTLKLLRVGRSSMELEVWIALAEDVDSVVARGRNVVVYIDQETGRSAALPPDAPERLSAYFAVPAGDI